VHNIVKGNVTKAIWLENFMKLVCIQVHPTVIDFDYQYIVVLIANLKWLVASYDGSLFTSLWTFYKVYSIQMPQTHCKIINLTKIFMD